MKKAVGLFVAATLALGYAGNSAAGPRAEASAIDAAKIRQLALTPGSVGREGVFRASIDAPSAPAGATAELRIATAASPVALRRRLAFHKLARALGASIVQACAERDLPLGALASWLAKDPPGLEIVRKTASVRNDGTVAALLLSPGPARAPFASPEGHAVTPSSVEVAAWARAAESEAARDDDALARDYVQWIALDYLAATTTRRTVFVTRDPPGLLLADNQYAFPLSASATAVSSELRRLRNVKRFPRGLRDGLAALDLARERALFAGGEFGEWLLSPRAIVELDERRLALLSLIEARVVAGGEDAVLTR